VLRARSKHGNSDLLTGALISTQLVCGDPTLTKMDPRRAFARAIGNANSVFTSSIRD